MTDQDAFAALDEQKIQEGVIQKLAPVIREEATKQAEEIVKQKLGNFAQSISGTPNEFGWSAVDKSGRPAPESWDEGAAKIAARAKEEAKREVLSEIEKKEQERANQSKLADEASKREMDATVKQWDEDWTALVEENELPGMSEESRKLIAEGKQVDISKDPGLSTRWELLQAALAEKQRTGKPVNLYRFYKTQYKTNPGMNAPVFSGGRGAVSQEKELSYEEIHELTKKAGFAR
jgi:Fe-S cluster biosynthesis and repair protein YggX